MLKITIPANELFDEAKQEFINIKEQTLQLEHSLVSLSKWESKWCKPFLDEKQKSDDEMIDYIKCMTITQNVDPNIYLYIPNDVREEIVKYIDSPMTATWFSEKTNTASSKNEEKITSELIYYWMISSNIPFECQKWHLNRLLTLIKVCSVKNAPPKKKAQRETISQYAALNAARKQKYKTRG